MRRGRWSSDGQTTCFWWGTRCYRSRSGGLVPSAVGNWGKKELKNTRMEHFLRVKQCNKVIFSITERDENVKTDAVNCTNLRNLFSSGV